MNKFVVVIILLFACNAFAQEGYMGKEFWLTFPQNAKSGENSATLDFRILITSDKDVKGVIEEPHVKKTTPFSIMSGMKGSYYIHNVDTLNQIIENGVSDKAIHIKSDNPISVVVLSHRKASTDSYMAIPVDKLGKTYVIAGYDKLGGRAIQSFRTQFDVIAIADNTNVKYILQGDITNSAYTETISLSKGQVLHVNSGELNIGLNDISGTTIVASNPVAVVSGHACAQIPADVNFCDILMEMPPPNSALGTKFIVPKLAKRGGYALRIFATVPNTKVIVSDGSFKTISVGEMYVNDHANTDLQIETSAPVLVAQYAQSSDADTIKVADPFMMFVPPNDRYIKRTMFVVPKMGEGWEHWVSIVVPRSGISGVTLNSIPLKSSLFMEVAGDGYSVVQIMVQPGVEMITSTTPITVYSYGYGFGGDAYDSYGHLCGQNLLPK